MEFPLSANQEPHWFAEECGEGAGVVAAAVELTGPFDGATLRRSWAVLVDRHEALRTTFGARHGVPYQVVSPARAIDFAHRDVAGDAEVRDLLEREAAVPFDVRTDPLARLRVCTRDVDRHWVLVVLHPLVADLTSAVMLLAELCGTETPALPARYQDFVAWQAEQLATPAAEERLTRLARGLTPAPLELPRATDSGGVVTGVMPAESVADLAGGDTGAALTTLFQLVLHRYTGQDRIVVGAMVDDRFPRFAPLVGNFANLVPVVLDLGGDPTFADVLARRRAPDAHLVPFTHLVRRVTTRRDPDRSPVCQAVHVHHAAATRILTTWPFELVLTSEETPAGLTLSLRYRAGVLDAATAAGMLANLTEFAAAAVAEPDRPLAKFPLTTERERWALASWNDTAYDHDTEAWVPDAFLAVAGERPDTVALRFQGRSVTYGELARRVHGLTHHLRERGIGRGSIVGVAVERSPELMVGLLATLAAGAAYLPLDPDYPAERIGFMVEDARPSLVLTQLGTRLPDLDVPVVALDRLVAEHDEPVPTRIDGDSLAYVIYTSGSTGRPKGVRITHRALRNRIAWTQHTFALTPADRVLQKTPSSFDVSVWEFFWPLTVGARLVLARPGGHRDVAHLVELIRAEGVTTVHFVPSVLRLFLAERDVAGCLSLRRVLCSGEALPPDAVDAFYERMSCELHNLYGPTEATVDVTWWPCRAGEPTTPIGRPVHNTRVHVLDRAGREVPVGAVGEIHLGGVQVAAGYLNRPVLTAERFVPDPFSADPSARLYRTGDLGRFRHDGAVEYLGRLDHQVKIYGNRVETGEIETRLVAHPGVADAVVTVSARDGATRLDAHVVPAGEAPEPADLLAHLHRDLPGFMVPSRIRFLAALPLTPSGKADRAALAASEGPLDRVGAGRPRTPAERTATRAAAAVLGLPEVRVDDNFFALGGDSMAALRLRSVLAARGFEVTVSDVVRATTFERLAGATEPAEPAEPAYTPMGGHAGGTAVELRLAGDLDEPALSAALDELSLRDMAVATRPGAGSFHLTLGPAAVDRWGMALLAARLVAEYAARSTGARPEFDDRVARAHTIPADILAGLRELARQAGTALHVVVLAAHLRVVGMLTGRREVTTAVVVDGRPEHAAGDRLVGDFNRRTPVRVDVRAGTWLDLVRRVRDAQVSDGAAETTFEHVDVDIAAVVRHAAPTQGVELCGWRVPRTASFDDTADPVLEVDEKAAVHYARVLAAMAVGPDGPADTDLRSDEERQVVERVNATTREWPAPVGAHHAVAEHARRAPDVVAVRCGGQELTYGELDARATAVAAAVRGAGVVAVAVTCSTDLPATLLGVHRAGAAYLPLDPAGEWPALDGVTVVATDRPDLAPADLPVLDLASVPPTAYEPPGPTDPSSPALVTADGRTLTHRALDNARRGLCARIGWQGEDEVLVAVTPDHAWLELFLPLATGGRLELATGSVELTEATTVLAPAAWWQTLVDAGWPGDPALRIVCTGAGRLPHGLARVLWRVHGCPETAFWSTAARVDRPGAAEVGVPLANTTCHVLGEDGREVPLGFPGELAIGTDRLYRTGKRVVRRPDGMLAEPGEEE